MSFKYKKYSKIYSLKYCAICDTPLAPGALFCEFCDPPLPPSKVPEETGMTLSKALIRIVALVMLFVAIVIGKYDISLSIFDSNDIFFDNSDVMSGKKSMDELDMKTAHLVTVPLANIRLKPLVNSKIIMIAEKDTILEIIEAGESWSKIRIGKNTGWISNKLFNSEAVVP